MNRDLERLLVRVVFEMLDLCLRDFLEMIIQLFGVFETFECLFWCLIVFNDSAFCAQLNCFCLVGNHGSTEST